MTFTLTVQDVVDDARIRHWAFADLAVGDGAALRFLQQRLRTRLGQLGGRVEGLVGTAMQYTLGVVNGLLIAEDNLGNPVYTTTYQDGWPIHLDGGGVPYYDSSEPMIATDPFGAHGGTPGFPLPSDMVRLIAVVLVLSQPTGMTTPVDIIAESARLTALPGRNPQAYVAGNRLVPAFPFYPSGSGLNSGDRWFNVASIQLSYIALPALVALSDFLQIPSVLVESLTADLAAFFAFQSKAIAQAERVAFAEMAASVAKTLDSVGLDLVNEPQTSSVQFLG